MIEYIDDHPLNIFLGAKTFSIFIFGFFQDMRGAIVGRPMLGGDLESLKILHRDLVFLRFPFELNFATGMVSTSHGVTLVGVGTLI